MKIWSKDNDDLTPGPVLAAKQTLITQIRQGGNIDWPLAVKIGFVIAHFDAPTANWTDCVVECAAKIFTVLFYIFV